MSDWEDGGGGISSGGLFNIGAPRDEQEDLRPWYAQGGFMPGAFGSTGFAGEGLVLFDPNSPDTDPRILPLLKQLPDGRWFAEMGEMQRALPEIQGHADGLSTWGPAIASLAMGGIAAGVGGAAGATGAESAVIGSAEYSGAATTGVSGAGGGSAITAIPESSPYWTQQAAMDTGTMTSTGNGVLETGLETGIGAENAVAGSAEASIPTATNAGNWVNPSGLSELEQSMSGDQIVNQGTQQAVDGSAQTIYNTEAAASTPGYDQSLVPEAPGFWDYVFDPKTVRQAVTGQVVGAGINAITGRRTANQLEGVGRAGAAAADPFASQRPFYQGLQRQVWEDPNFVASTPGYLAGLNSLNARSAKLGQMFSGQNAQDLTNFGMGQQMNLSNALSPLSGASTGNPGEAGRAITNAGYATVRQREDNQAAVGSMFRPFINRGAEYLANQIWV